MRGSMPLQGYPFDAGLPNGWAMAPLGMVAESIRPGFASGEHNKEAEGIPHLRPMNISSQGEIDLSVVRYVATDKSFLRIEEGEVLFNNTNSPAWVGKTAVIREGGEYAFSNHMTRIKVDDRLIDSDFMARQLHYLSRSGYFQIHCKKHVNQASISSSMLEQSVPMLVPPLNEQKRIVARIEELQARSRRAREALENVPVLLEQLRQSILAAAFRGDLTKKWRDQHPGVEPASVLLKRIRAERRKRWEESELKKLKAKGLTGNQLDAKFTKRRKQYQEPAPVDTTDLPQLPAGWCWTDLSQLKTYSIYGPRFSNDDYSESGTFVLRTTDIDESGRVNTEKAPRIRLSDEERFKYYIQVGDLLITRTGSIGTLAVYNDDVDAIPGAYLLHYRLAGNSELPWTIFHQLRSPRCQYEMTGGAAGTGRPNLNAPTLEAIPLVLPPANEQTVILETLNSTLSLVDSLQQRFDSLLDQCLFFDQTILSKAFRGELVPQDPKDKPASALLERIRQEKISQTANQKTNGKRKGK